MSLQPSKINDMSGLHVLITGAGTGIGLMIAKTYAAHGAVVYLVGRRSDKLQEAVKSIRGLNAEAEAVILPGDVSRREGMEKLVADYKAVSGQSHLDILVANAGIFRLEAERWSPDLDPEALSRQLTSSTMEQWAETAAVNTASPYLLTGLFVPLLAKAEDGNVIVTSSIAGLHYSPTSSNPSYSASKAAVNHLVKILANRLSPHYIRVNAICPGMFPSEMNDDEAQKRLGPAIQKIPAKRLGTELEMGQTALFIGMCRYLDGQAIAVDGGRSLGANGN